MLQHQWLNLDMVMFLVTTYQGEWNTMVRKKDNEWKEQYGYLLEIGWLKVARETEKSFWYDITELGKQALAYELSLYYVREITVEKLDVEVVRYEFDIDVYKDYDQYDASIKRVKDRLEIRAKSLLTEWDGLIPVDADDTHPLFQMWLKTNPVPKYTHWAILSMAYKLQNPDL